MIGVNNSKVSNTSSRRMGAGIRTSSTLFILWPLIFKWSHYLLFLFQTRLRYNFCRIALPCLFLWHSALLSGQSSNSNFAADFKHIPLTEALASMKEKYNLKIAYDDKALDKIVIDRTFEGLSLGEAIDNLLANTGLVYKILGKDKVLIRTADLAELPTDVPEELSLSGQVLDPISGEGLAFATITTLDGKRGTIADEMGKFFFRVSEGETKLRVQYLGYQGKDIEVKQAEKSIIVNLHAVPQEIPGITILEQMPTLGASQADGANVVHGGAMYRLPSFIGGVDAFRNIQLLPGVAAHDDLSADLKIRGGEGNENLIILDGINLYYVDHYFGIFSAINANMVEEINLYKNSFPVEYGGRLSGLVEIKTHEVLNEKAAFNIGVDLLTTNASMQVPIVKNMAVLLGGRMTNNNIADHKIFNLLQQEQQSSVVKQLTNTSTITRPTVIGIEPDFHFYDANAKWIWQYKPTTRLTASFFQGFDQFDYTYQEIFRSRLGPFQINNKETNEENANWRNTGFSFQVEQDWSPKWQSHLNVNTSFYKETSDLQNSLLQASVLTGEIIRERSQFLGTQNTIHSSELNLKNTLSISPLEDLVLGYQLVKNKVSFDISAEAGQILNRNDEGYQHTLYGEYAFHLGKPLSISAGLRATHYNLTNQWYLSPHLLALYQANEQFLLKSSWNINQQFTREIYHEDRFGRTFDILTMAKAAGFPVAASEQFMLGGNFKMAGLEVDLEMYRKATTGMIEYAQIRNGRGELGKPIQRTDFRFFEGDRLTRGLDLLLKKSIGPYSGWLAYTLSKTTLRFPAISKGVPFPSVDDRRHQLKWVNQYRWKKWDFSLVYIFSSGTPYTDISLLGETSLDREEISPAERISYLEDYHRVDAGLNYSFPLWGGKARVGGSIFNLFDRKNVKQRQYIYSITESRNENDTPINTVLGTELQLLDFTPNLSFSFSF
ncbi:MAG: TonB-dependent receptor [Saprospiraceae bacterium]